MMHLRAAECRIPFLLHCDLDIWPQFYNDVVWDISPIVFDVEIPKLIC